MIDINFQTEEKNQVAMAKLEAAKETLSAVTEDYYEVMQEVFPVGAHLRMLVGPGPRYSNYEVIGQRKVPSPWMTLRNCTTGRVREVNLCQRRVELVTYSYKFTSLGKEAKNA